MPLTIRGRCHICTRDLDVTYCPGCGHWFCEACKAEWWPRGWAAVKDLLFGSPEDCCGPQEAA